MVEGDGLVDVVFSGLSGLVIEEVRDEGGKPHPHCVPSAARQLARGTTGDNAAVIIGRACAIERAYRGGMPARSNDFQAVVYFVERHLAADATVTESASLTDRVTGQIARSTS